MRLPVAPIECVVAGDAVLSVANRLGVLAAVGRTGGRTATDVADELGLDAAATRVLLDALAEIEIVDRNGSKFSAHPDVPRVVRMMSTVTDALERRVRTGEPTLSGGRPDEASRLYEGLVGMLGTFFAEAAEEVAEQLAQPGLAILDAGAGSAPWSRAIVQREPTCTVVALDLPEVIDRTRQSVAEAGLEDRFHYLEADVLDVDLAGEQYDLVLAANLCHLFDAATTERLIRRLVAAGRPGGSVAIIDAVPEHDGADRRRYVALYAAGLLTRTASGGVHGFSDYARWLRGAGAEAVGRYDCVAFPSTVIRADVPRIEQSSSVRSRRR